MIKKIICVLSIMIVVVCGGCNFNESDATETTTIEETTEKKCTHNVVEWTITKEATCTKAGEKEGVCTLCGETVNESIHSLGHTPGESSISSLYAFNGKMYAKLTANCTKCGEEIDCGMRVATDEEARDYFTNNNDYKTVNYSDWERNPSLYKNEKIKITGEIVQVVESSSSDYYSFYRIDIGDWDIVGVWFDGYDVTPRILEGDTVTFYGYGDDLYTYESVAGGPISIPSMYAGYRIIH